MLQPLQFAKGWKEIPDDLVAITDLEPCPRKDCKEVTSNIPKICIFLLNNNSKVFNMLPRENKKNYIYRISGNRKGKSQDKDPALKNLKPDKTFFLGYDIYRVPNPRYHHEKFYPMETMELIDRESKTPQFNHISLNVSMVHFMSTYDNN